MYVLDEGKPYIIRTGITNHYNETITFQLNVYAEANSFDMHAELIDVTVPPNSTVTYDSTLNIPIDCGNGTGEVIVQLIQDSYIIDVKSLSIEVEESMQYQNNKIAYLDIPSMIISGYSHADWWNYVQTFGASAGARIDDISGTDNNVVIMFFFRGNIENSYGWQFMLSETGIPGFYEGYGDGFGPFNHYGYPLQPDTYKVSARLEVWDNQGRVSVRQSTHDTGITVQVVG